MLLYNGLEISSSPRLSLLEFRAYPTTFFQKRNPYTSIDSDDTSDDDHLSRRTIMDKTLVMQKRLLVYRNRV